MPEGTDRDKLRRTFDSAAEQYDRARPEYPAALFDELIACTRLKRGARLLEVGSATGKATLPLAQRGFDITCVELGADLASIARERLAEFPHVRIVNADFDTWTPPQDRRFDLVFAATAWHWLDPAGRYERAADLLAADGHLAVWSATHVFPEHGDQFFTEIQEVYDEIGEGLPPGTEWPRPGSLRRSTWSVTAAGYFSES